MQKFTGIYAFWGKVVERPWTPPLSEPSSAAQRLPDLSSPGWALKPHLEKREQWFPHEKSGSLALGRQQRNFLFPLHFNAACVCYKNRGSLYFLGWI